MNLAVGASFVLVMAVVYIPFFNPIFQTEALTFAEARWNSDKKQQQIASLEKLNKAISAQKLAEAKQHKFVVIALIFILF